MAELFYQYLGTLLCIAATFGLIALCSGLVLLTREIWWKGEEQRHYHRAELRGTFKNMIEAERQEDAR